MDFSWKRWREFEALAIKDAWQTSREKFHEIRNTAIVALGSIAIATFVFRKYVDYDDLWIAVLVAVGVAVLYFIWRTHCAVPRIYKHQADRIEELEKLTVPRISLAYDPSSCCRDTTETTRGFLIRYVSVEVTGPANAAIRSARVFLHQVEKLGPNGFAAVGIEGGPSLEWTRADDPSEQSHMPSDIGPGHTRLVNVFYVPDKPTPKILPCVRTHLNREIDLLDGHGTYRFIVRANCDGLGGYAELVLRVTWAGSIQTMFVEAEAQSRCVERNGE